jgi:hypothetical protein
LPGSLHHTSRRSFLRLAAAGSTAALIPSCWKSPPSKSFDIPGEFVGGSFRIGHLLRQPDFASKIPEEPEEGFEVAIVGGGISGLSAAWKLRKSGVKNLCVLELEPWLGGTSSFGKANGTEFPWAAHYLNIPPPEADCLNEVLEDIGVIRGFDKSGFPEIPDEYPLKWPKERLFWKGQWREWNPYWKAPEWEREVLMQFEDDMLRWTLFKGRDGRRAFALPVMYSSRDPRVLKLDQISFKDYIRSKGWNSPRLDWELNYACRDDYGGTIETISAWAGIHYHACRNYDPRLHKEYPSHTMTWTAGNGFLVQKLAEGIADKRTGCLALSIENRKGHTEVGYYDVEKEICHRVRARAVVFAAKQHTAPFVIRDLPEEQKEVFSEITFTPWLTAAIHVKRLPTDVFHPPAWDNMIYKGDALGYIVADHQIREQRETDAPSVLVYYLPFFEKVDDARSRLLDRNHKDWVNVIMNDLSRADDELADLVQRIDVYRWGHAMIRPDPGTLWGKSSELRRRPFGRVFFASCDATGLPLFEEACFNGIRAAEEVMEKLDVDFDTSLKGLDPASTL